MTMTLIDKETYERLLQIQKEYPELTFQNQGYEYLNSDIFERNTDAIKEINGILKNCIKGFCEFNNFRLEANKDIMLRFQYMWDGGIYFKGVGYLRLSYLLNGFPEGEGERI